MSNLWNFSGESAGIGAGVITLVEGSTFVLSRPGGDFRRVDPHGLFCLDTRILSDWILLVGGEPVESLTTIPLGPFEAQFVGRRALPGGGDTPLTVIRHRVVGTGMIETIEIRNHGPEHLHTDVGFAVGSDFASLFDVKADRVHEHAPTAMRWEGETNCLELTNGHEGLIRATTIEFDRSPLGNGDRLTWSADIAPGERWSMRAEVGFRAGGTHAHPGPAAPTELTTTPTERFRRWQSEVPRISSNFDEFDSAVARSTDDLGALRILDPIRPDRIVVAAGAPWFMTLFGRDSILTSWMTLPIDHELALGVLRTLAETQGTEHHSATEEEPGRILHEVRSDPSMSDLLGGRHIYYGTVDATPLFVMLAGEYLRWTGRIDLLRPLIPAIDRAMDWIRDRIDADPHGFISYRRATDTGLENQGWKDSWDGIRYRDGRVARAPIKLVEVQAYVYGAHIARAELAAALEDHDRELAERRRAVEFQHRFHDSFWLDDAGHYAVGLDETGAAIDSLTSNVGHCLWTGIAPPDAARSLAHHLAGPDLFSGWGVRTLAASSGGFNPISYHCGSVWPHDTAICVAGLARYGFDEAATTITNALIESSTFSGGRLPELFAGFDRSDLPAPIPYPTSCSPQAWAAAAPFLLVRAMLGLEPDTTGKRVRLRPRLPDSITRLHIGGIPIAGERVTIDLLDGRLQCTGLPHGMTLEIA